MALLGYALEPNGECILARGYGDTGISRGVLTPVLGWDFELSILTMPAMAGRTLLFTSPLLGSVGYTPLTEQSDRLTPSGILAREILDYPSYVQFFKPLFYLLKHEGGRGVTSLDVELPLRWGVGSSVAVVVANDSERGERYVRWALRLLGEDVKPLWKGSFSVRRVIKRPGEGLRGALLDLGRNLSLERTLSSLGSVDIYPPGMVPPPEEYSYLVVSSGPGDPVDRMVEGFLRPVLERWLGKKPVVATGHGAVALFKCIGVDLLPKKERGIVEILRPLGGRVRGDVVILHTYIPQVEGWELFLRGEGATGVHDLAWVDHERGLGGILTEDRGEGTLEILRSLEVIY